MTQEVSGYLKKNRSLAAGVAVVSILVAIECAVIFTEGWHFRGFDICYLYTALQNFHSAVVDQSGFLNLIVATGFHDNPASPLYIASTMLGHLGKPSPEWFRASGLVVLVFIFSASYHLRPKPCPSIDRLVMAVSVATAPAVFLVCRYLDDYSLHILLLLIGAVALVRSDYGRKTTAAISFYVVPAASLFLAHMITHFLIAMMSWAGMYFFSVAARIRAGDQRFALEVKKEIPRLVLCAVLLILAAINRGLPFGAEFFSYYSQEAGGNYAFGASFADHLLAYPEVVAFSAAGLILCGLACACLLPGFRSRRAGLFLFWFLPPLLLLTVAAKKNVYYIWIAVPAVSLLASEVINRLPARWKKLWVLACLGFAAMHLFHFASPLESLINGKVFETGPAVINENTVERDRLAKSSDMILAQAVLDHASKCGDPRGRPLVAYHPSPFLWRPVRLYFAMLSIDRRPKYWFADLMPFEVSMQAVVVRIDSGTEELSGEPIQDDIWARRFSSHREIFQSAEFRVYCPDETEPRATTQDRPYD